MRAQIFKIKSILLISLCILIFSGFKHPFYLSVTELKFNAAEQRIQGSVKIFVNDLEASLKTIHKKPVDLINIKDTLTTQRILQNYLSSHLSIQVNGKFIDYQQIGFEREQETIWLFIESSVCETPKKVSIQNSILYDQLPQQMNIVHFEVLDQTKSSKLNFPDRALEFHF